MFTVLNFRTIALLLLVAILLSCASIEPKASLEGRAIDLDQRLICPVCPSETIDQSQTELAQQMRRVVRQKLQDGYSDRQIEEFFIARYGERVLASPRREGFGLLVWVVPPALVVLGLIGFWWALREMRKDQISAMYEETDKYTD